MLIHTSADSAVDCVGAEIAIFLSLQRNTIVHWGIRRPQHLVWISLNKITKTCKSKKIMFCRLWFDDGNKICVFDKKFFLKFKRCLLKFEQHILMNLFWFIFKKFLQLRFQLLVSEIIFYYCFLHFIFFCNLQCSARERRYGRTSACSAWSASRPTCSWNLQVSG